MRIDGIYVLYRVLEYLGLPFILLYLLIRGLKDRRYFHLLLERLGRLPPAYSQTRGGAIWLHAVSVGEVLSAVELVRVLRARFPAAPLFVSSTTLAGRAVAEQKLAGLAGVFYAPVDFSWAVRRVLRTLRPRVLVIVETEIWPNLYREARAMGCRLIVVNGRISDRALPRYRALGWFFRGVLKFPDCILAQNETSRQRFIEIGAPAEKIEIAGNLKYDFDPANIKTPEAVRAFVEALHPQAIWIAASTMPPAHAGDIDEDDVVIRTFRQLGAGKPGLLLILVPRKPERFDVVADKLAKAGVSFTRRTALAAAFALPGVLLLDTIGELSGIFSLADLVFMGGTLAERGGHNILEPAFFGLPVIVGPHMENFSEIAAEYAAADASVRIASAEQLPGAVTALLENAQLRADLGRRARKLAEAKRGATAIAVERIASLYGAPQRPRMRPLSRLWRAGVEWRGSRAIARPLKTPVISVGGISMGGTGKTPFVAWLAEQLNRAGARPGILTRGYRRRSREKVTILHAGASATPALTGDEAQIFLRAAIAPVGIGADRFEVGRRMEQQFSCGVFLLDDGFQHWRLARDLDIVLIDALDPFGGGELFPHGRLREPLAALARADIFVITRTEPGGDYSDIISALKEHNPAAPVFTSRVVAASLPQVSKAAAFCALANPETFWRTLETSGIHPALKWTFRDHHCYTTRELRRIAAEAHAAGADALVTTEKDAANLPDGWREAIAPLRLEELRIRIEVDGQDRLLALVWEKTFSPE